MVTTRRQTLQPIQRKASASNSQTAPSLKYIDKKNILSKYVQILVDKKIASKSKSSSLKKNIYAEQLEIIHNLGLTWVTLNSLKLRVNRAYRKLVSHCPPPPGSTVAASSITNSFLSSQQNAATPTQSTPTVSYGHPKGTSIVDQHRIAETHLKAKNLITRRYYEKISEYNNIEKRGKVPDGSFKEIVSTVVKEMKLDASFHFPYRTMMKHISQNQMIVEN